MGKKLIDYLGINKYIHHKEVKKEILLEMNYNDVPYGSYIDHYDEYADEIVEKVINMLSNEVNKDDIKFEVSEILYSKEMLNY
jgi:nitrogenase subunit NifH